MNNRFTFAIISYNQQDFILETLESIKYQIQHYGSDIHCSLIIGDDHSSDDTVALAKRWIKTYHNLFSQIDVISRAENVGLNRNYLEVLCKIQDAHYKIIAGDDLFSCENVFEWGKEGCINAYYPMILNHETLSIDDEIANRVLYFANVTHCNQDDRFRVALGNYMNTPSVFVDKALMTKAVQDHIAAFRNFEDDPGWYSVLVENSSATTQFYAKCKVIYRIHENSLSHGLPSEKNRMFFEDLMRFKLDCAGSISGICRKISLFLVFLYLRLMDLNRWTIYFSPVYYFEKYKGKYYKKMNGKHADYIQNLNKMEVQLQRNILYYQEIRSNAEHFRAKYVR
ncbi:hypothetical protein IMSAG185_01375 [Lachnospiraceae bacterium]|jgi:glycosyltransferase involved in cell wall biosynthesis|nr:hypothetical protein IMSAG185_01375 [Lachnospiraceae bacterium]